MPRSASDSRRIREQRRAQLLEAAEHEFVRHGVEATRIGAIAARARTSHGLFYHYFADKTEALAEVLRQGLARAAAALDAHQSLYEAIESVLRWAREDAGLLRLAAAVLALPGRHGPRVDAVARGGIERLFAAWTRRVRLAQRAGLVDEQWSPRTVASLLLAFVQSYASSHPVSPTEARQVVERLGPARSARRGRSRSRAR